MGQDIAAESGQRVTHLLQRVQSDEIACGDAQELEIAPCDESGHVVDRTL